tara:strand:+ start:1446 stop:1928 length:483 start_codon:yes stop_codon:yes gene_type:complete
MSNYNKKKDPYVACKSNKIWNTGRKAPIAEYERNLTEIEYTCSITKRKFKPSQMPMQWWKQPEIQQYASQGWICKKEYIIQEPFQQPKYGENLELIEVFRMKRPYQKRANMGTFKRVDESIPAVAQSFAPDNSKPITKQDLDNMDDKIPMGDDDEWNDQF